MMLQSHIVIVVYKYHNKNMVNEQTVLPTIIFTDTINQKLLKYSLKCCEFSVIICLYM